jgi:phosphonoacetaldehyde hydrolase
MTYPIKAVIFDWAGTMVDFGCLAPVSALRAAFAAEGVDITADDARRDMGRAKRDHVWALLTYKPVADSWTRARGAAPTPVDCDRVYAALEPLMSSAAEGASGLIAGAASVAAALRAKGVRIGSCTGYTRMMMAPVLARAAAQGYAPDVVVCAGETPAGRPSPLMLWKALVDMGVWPAHACVKVDDAEVGIEEGRAAGCWTIGVAASGNGVGLGLDAFRALPEAERAARVAAAGRALRAAGADFVVDTVAELTPAFDEIAALIDAGARPPRASPRDPGAAAPS